MCGFVAVIAPSGDLSLSVLDRMRDRLSHRGPDGRASWTERVGAGVVGLGHRRLSIIDLSDAASQPMFSADRMSVIVFNGEIYNFVELRAELQSLGSVFQTRSDTEVLLAAYDRWGSACLSRLNGMFAFAVWDRRRQIMFVARDRFGEKPVFFARLRDGGVAIASEMKALFAHPGVAAAADFETVAQYVSGQYYEDGEQTFFDGIKRLPPAHAMELDGEARVLRRWRYWTPDYCAIQSGYKEGEAVEHFRELMERSVRMRLRADVPIGTSLSGGLDSSFLVCLIARFRDEQPLVRQHVFSARFNEDPTLSEGPQIDVVVKESGVKAFSVTPDPLRLVEESRLLHWHQEEPFLSASIYLQWCVMRLARDYGTTVLIDGQGADELLAGYQFYFRSHQLDQLDRAEFLSVLRDTRTFTRRLRAASRGYVDSRRRFNAEIALPMGSLFRYWLWRQQPFGGPYDVGVPPVTYGMRLRRQIAEALQYNCLPTLLRYADRSAMAFGRETRFPFLDYGLVDWCVSLPDRAFIHDGWQKVILRKASEGLVPPSIQWRADKVGYAAPLDVWLRGPLKAWAYQHLFSGPVAAVPGYDAGVLKDLWHRHQSGNEELSWPLWRWISLGEWFSLLEGQAWRSGFPG
jgi:asparagine synthase (glutamine-hydrolysing)